MNEQWLNLETSVVCIDAIAGLRKCRMGRVMQDGPGKTREVLMHGIAIHFKGGGGMELDFLEEDHCDQVYDAIWQEIKGEGPKLTVVSGDDDGNSA